MNEIQNHQISPGLIEISYHLSYHLFNCLLYDRNIFPLI